jgi:hypothetical protein
MSFRSIRVLLLTAALALPLGAADAELLRLTRPDVNFLLGVRLSDIAASPLVRTMLDEALASKPELQALSGMVGTNPLEGFDELLVAANIDAQSPQDPKDALVVFSGALDPKRLEGIFCSEGCEREPYGNLELLKVERKDADTPGYLAVLDGRYAALGERPAVLRAIDRFRKGSAASFGPEMRSWIDRLGRYHLWLAAKGPFNPPSADEPGPAMMAAGAASKLKGVGLGLLLEDDVSLALELESGSAQDATELYEMAQGLLAMARMGQQQEQPAAGPGSFDLLKSLKLTNAGRVVSASLTIPQRELNRQLRAKLEEKRDEAGPELEAGLHAESHDAPAVRVAPRSRPSNSIRVYGIQPRAVEYPLTPK